MTDKYRSAEHKALQIMRESVKKRAEAQADARARYLKNAENKVKKIDEEKTDDNSN